MRKLASIQCIKALEPIEGADAIEKATVLGWELVVKKGEFKTGDLVVYCEIDSILPDRPEYEFLKPRGMRIRTIRLRGQISQGICFPLSVLPKDFVVEEGADCTEALGVVKYEPPIPAQLAGLVKGHFPSFIPKTDETRVQVLQDVLDKYQGEVCYIAEKLDGSSVTYFFRDGEFGVCSRNLELLEDSENTLWKVANDLNLPLKLQRLGKNIALQGELIGEGIQGNKLKIRGQTARFFNVFDIDRFRYLGLEDFTTTLQELELDSVPILSTDFVLEQNIPALVALATVKSVLNPEAWAEGIVIRPLQEKRDAIMDGVLSRVSFKVINPEFLLKYGD